MIMPKNKIRNQATAKVPRRAPAQLATGPSAGTAAPVTQAETAFVIFDLETTGLYPGSCEIIQIAATRFANGRATGGEAFFSYCRPRHPIPRFITDYTGITERDVRTAPQPIEVLAQFSAYVGEAVIMAHNGHRFDIKFLEATCLRHGVTTRKVESIDTITLSKRLFGATRGTGHSLDAVLDRLGLRASQYQRHDARGDVQALADAVARMWRRLDLDPHCSGIPRRETALPVV
jgi:DNA polymerase III epsilon subunit family exonuclease